MKNFLVIFCSLFTTPLWAVDAYSLKTTFSKNPVYEGETITLQFILYGTSDFVEAEVQKFPEFRGYWTQNQVLRQGPLPLIPKSLDPFGIQGHSMGTMNQALIGSYTITPMMGQKDRAIIPMKMIIRPNMEIESESEELAVRPLPTLSKDITSFYGAVGNLFMAIDNETLMYHPDEPVTLRVYLRGKANFADITELDTPWKHNDKIKLVSERTFLDATIPPTKIFEYSLLIPKDAPQTLGSVHLTYFDPHASHYETLATPEIHLQLQPAPPKETLSANLFPPPIQEEESVFAPLKSPFFWSLNIGLAIFFFVLIILQFKQAREKDPKVKYKKALTQEEERLKKNLKGTDALNTMRSLEHLIMSSEPIQSEKIRTHNKALKKLGKLWPEKSTRAAQWVMETWDKSYAPTKELPILEEKDTKKLHFIFKALKRSFWR